MKPLKEWTYSDLHLIEAALEEYAENIRCRTYELETEKKDIMKKTSKALYKNMLDTNKSTLRHIKEMLD